MFHDGRSSEGYTDWFIRDLNQRVHALSLSGRYSQMLDARAMLHSRNTANLERTFLRVSEIEYQDNLLVPVRTRTYFLQGVGYRVAFTRLGEHAHLIAVAQSAFGNTHPYLLLGSSGRVHEAIEKHLKEKTPVPFLPEWIPWLTEQLFEMDYLEELVVDGNDYMKERYGAWLLKIDADGIQMIISSGLSSGAISIGNQDPDAKELNAFARQNLTNYIREFRGELADIITNQYNPRYHPSTQQPTWPTEQTKRRLFRAQADVVQGVCEIWKDSNWAMVVGEMGVGKGLIGPTTAFAHAHSKGEPYRSLVVCPGHLVGKWKREIESIIPNAKVQILRDWEQLLSIDPKKRPEVPEYIILSRSRMKLHYQERCGAVRIERNGHVVYRCPDCGVYLPSHWNMERKGKTNQKCLRCGTKLWQADNTRKPRFSMAEWISKRMRGWADYLVIDEIHEDKSGDSIQGQAMGKLVRAAKKVLGLTGTLLGGYADDLFYLLFRLEPAKMKRLGFNYNSVDAFIARYGTVEHTRRRVRDASGEERTQNRYRRLPGVSPMLFPTFLMDNTCFIDLSDLGHELPAYTEEVLMVDMDDELRTAYRQMEEALRVDIGSQRRSGRVNLGSYINTLLAYPDHPYINRPIVHRNHRTGEQRVVYEPQVLDEGITRQKEQELVWLIRSEREQGRRCYVYVNFTGDWKAHERLAAVLEGEGLKVAVLTPQTVNQENRESWIARKVEEGVDVIISHPRLVQTGLDLYEFPTMIVYQTGMSIYTIRQAVRRSWRIGQTKPVRVVFLAYRETLQDDLLRLMGSKLEAATALEGKFSEEGLRAMADTEDMTSALARALVEGLEGVESAEAIWQRIATQPATRKNVSEISPYAVRTLGEMIELGIIAAPTKKTKRSSIEMGQLVFDFFDIPDEEEVCAKAG